MTRKLDHAGTCTPLLGRSPSPGGSRSLSGYVVHLSLPQLRGEAEGNVSSRLPLCYFQAIQPRTGHLSSESHFSDLQNAYHSSHLMGRSEDTWKSFAQRLVHSRCLIKHYSEMSRPGSAQVGQPTLTQGFGAGGGGAEPTRRKPHTADSRLSVCGGHLLPQTKQHTRFSSRAVAGSWGADGLRAVLGVLERGPFPEDTFAGGRSSSG